MGFGSLIEEECQSSAVMCMRSVCLEGGITLLTSSMSEVRSGNYIYEVEGTAYIGRQRISMCL